MNVDEILKKAKNNPHNIRFAEMQKLIEAFIAMVPDLPGCAAHDSTEEEDLREVKIAEGLWLKVAKEDNMKIPKACVIQELTVS
ncbi:MAG: type II toxin-antitoxin system HicB family antitoxin [Candidatus Anammoxibacter sp.]